jgi:hypothetical protein
LKAVGAVIEFLKAANTHINGFPKEAGNFRKICEKLSILASFRINLYGTSDLWKLFFDCIRSFLNM